MSARQLSGGKNLLAGAILLALAAGCSQIFEPRQNRQQPAIDVSACGLAVPEPFRNGYADFTLVVLFRVTQEGGATEIRTLRNPAGIEKDEIEACLSNWWLPALPAAEDGVAKFRWEHNPGWVAVSVVWDNLTYEVPLGGRGGSE